MTGTLREPAEIRRRLEGAVSEARRDGLVFAVLTVLLTPVFIAVSVVLILAAALYADLPVVDHYGYWKSFATGTNLFLIFMFLAFFARPKRRGSAADLAWVCGAMAALGAILALTYLTPLATAHRGLFWSLYGGLTIALFGLLGRAYEPADDYYLGWFNGWMDDPFTVQDDYDRGHLALGMAAMVPALLFGSYGAIFGSSWLVRGLDGAELGAAASALHALGRADAGEAQRALTTPGRKAAARILRALDTLKLVSAARGGLRLADEGEKLVGINPYV